MDVAAPAVRVYHLVQHDRHPDWDITVECPGYGLAADVAFKDVGPAATRVTLNPDRKKTRRRFRSASLSPHWGRGSG